MKKKSIDELAMEYVVFSGKKCSNHDELMNHMHEMYLIYEEMCRRTGYDRTVEAVDRAQNVLNIIIPEK